MVNELPALEGWVTLGAPWHGTGVRVEGVLPAFEVRAHALAFMARVRVGIFRKGEVVSSKKSIADHRSTISGPINQRVCHVSRMTVNGRFAPVFVQVNTVRRRPYCSAAATRAQVDL